MAFLLVIWSPKQSAIEESSLESMAKQWKAQKHEEPKLWIFKVLRHKQIRNARRGSKEKSAMKHSRGQSLSVTFGALPGAQFMHTICSFEAWEVSNPMLQTVYDSELKWKSYSHWKPITPSWRQISQGYEISLELRNHKRTAVKSAFGCEIVSFMLRNFIAILHGCEILLKLPDICDRHFEIFCFRYLMSKSPNSPYNPPIIGFLNL